MLKSVFVISSLWLGICCTESIATWNDSMFPVARSEMAGPGMALENTPGHPALAQGILLIAGKNLVDPIFARTVVLITEHDANGTTGLVLNRRTNISPGHALPQLGEFAAHLDPIHLGGPVAANHIRLLVKSDHVPQGAKLVVDHIFLVDSMETLRQLDPESNNQDNIRVYMGFAGWAPGQLETELVRGDWHTWPAGNAIIFSKTPENIWYELIYLATAKWT